MNIRMRKDGFLVTVFEGDYGTDERRAIVREEGAKRGRSGRRACLGFFFPGMEPDERQALIDRWRR